MSADDDSSSDSEIELKRKLVLMQFVEADDSDDYEIVDDPLSDDENDTVDHDRYDRDIELQKLEPVARLVRAYNIRGYPEHRKVENLEDGKWYCTILDGEHRKYKAIDQNRYIAYHLAAIYFMKDLIKQSGTWMTQLGLPNDESKCFQILDKKFQELKLKSVELEEIDGKNPILFLNEFCSFYKSKVTIKIPVYECKEDKSGRQIQFCCNGSFRGLKLCGTKTSKQDARTEVARMFIKKMKEKDEIRPFIEDSKIVKRAKVFKDHIVYSECETQQKFDHYFQDDPFRYAVECNGKSPDIQNDKEKRQVTIAYRDFSFVFKTDSVKEAKEKWAIGFLRKAFVDRWNPAFFELHLPLDMIDALNESCHEIRIPEPWENEER